MTLSRGASAGAGPFYHGSRRALSVGDLFVAGFESSRLGRLKTMHVYFSAEVSVAVAEAVLAGGDGEPRVYLVEPLGDFEDDPKVTDEKFSGNPAQSYRCGGGVLILGEVFGWKRMSLEEELEWRARIEATNDSPFGVW